MHTLPIEFNRRMQDMLGAEVGSFFDALQRDAPVSIRYNRRKPSAEAASAARVPWCPSGAYLPERPVFTLDPLWHGGAYYVQEASSMFVEQAAAWQGQAHLRVLDLCAAPGGKSTHLADAVSPDALLVSNESIRSRVAALAENMAKWGSPNVAVTHNDPADFARLPSFFDVMLVDAPCSGEGMFRKDREAAAEWSATHVRFCADRQRRIVADAWDALKDGGTLLYSTCTYNRDENDANIRWIVQHLGAEVVHLPLPPAWNIAEDEYGYRFFPHRVQGEGFFISILRKCGARHAARSVRREAAKRLPPAAPPRPPLLHGEFVTTHENAFVRAYPAALAGDMAYLMQHLRVSQAGVAVGEIKGGDLAPAAALALSAALHRDAFPRQEVDLPTALRYLHRDAISLPDAPKGFCVVCYRSLPLGFVKNIGVRSNNLYPSAWRIRMDI
ncbi:MAG: rRNA cytosine-C5-methyltransferase [Prevotellaceae bacterium]|jgi:16S rRNA C967 or C1407 C5-methylase (RsmB/RsmF family)/NOL1/NOP2/fmu family ribosome biogenesis protein|nr:rRNA cytosine-C5-methyltransferase [Prevotellaceae bacterium]